MKSKALTPVKLLLVLLGLTWLLIQCGGDDVQFADHKNEVPTCSPACASDERCVAVADSEQGRCEATSPGANNDGDTNNGGDDNNGGADNNGGDDNNGTTNNGGADNNGGSNNDPSELPCNKAMACINDCDPSDPTCSQQCMASLSSDELQVLQDIGDCAGDNNCEDPSCLESECTAEVEACCGDVDFMTCMGGGMMPGMPGGFDPGQNNGGGVNNGGGGDNNGGGGGTGTCEEGIECFVGCNPTDTACLSGCHGSTDADEWDKVMAYFDCVARNQCQSPDCIRAECATEYDACYGEGSAAQGVGGNKNCEQAFRCVQPCSPGDTQCVLRCMIDTQEAEWNTFATYGQCLSDNGCQDTDNTCIGASCSTEYEACFDQPVPGT